MTVRWFELSVQRVWTVRVTDDSLNLDAVYDKTVGEFLNVNLADYGEIIEIEPPLMEYFDDAEYGQFWDYGVGSDE